MPASIPLLRTSRRGDGRSASALLERVGFGERDAFGELFDLLGPAVLTVARGRRDSESAALSLVQEVFLRLWRSAPRFLQQDLPAEVWIVSLVDETVGAPARPRVQRPPADPPVRASARRPQAPEAGSATGQRLVDADGSGSDGVSESPER